MSQMNKSSSKWRKDEQIPHTERDLDLLVELLLKKYMTTSQMMKLFWLTATSSPMGALKACQRRLRQLERYGVIRRVQQAALRTEGRKEDLFTLDSNSISLLVNERGIPQKLIDLRSWMNEANNPQIHHLLELTNAQIKWKDACVACEIRLESWVNERAIRIQYVKEAGTFVDKNGYTFKKPIADAFFILTRDTKQAYYWLEIDRSNINIGLSVSDRPTIAGKIQRFLSWEQSAAFREEFGTRPLRNLFITRGVGRMRNMLEVSEQMITEVVEENTTFTDEQRTAESRRLAKRFSFTTFELFYAHNPLTHPIWYQVGIETPQVLLA